MVFFIGSYTLVGVVDEHGWLEPDEIFGKSHEFIFNIYMVLKLGSLYPA